MSGLGRYYEVEDSIATVTSAATLLALTLPADLSAQVVEASITTSLSNNEQFAAALDTSSAAATGGGAVVAIPLIKGSIATSVTELSASAAAITGVVAENILVGAEYAPSVVGWHYKPLDGEGLVLSPLQILILSTLTAISSATVRVRVVFKEIGG